MSWKFIAAGVAGAAAFCWPTIKSYVHAMSDPPMRSKVAKIISPPKNNHGINAELLDDFQKLSDDVLQWLGAEPMVVESEEDQKTGKQKAATEWKAAAAGVEKARVVSKAPRKGAAIVGPFQAVDIRHSGELAYFSQIKSKGRTKLLGELAADAGRVYNAAESVSMFPQSSGRLANYFRSLEASAAAE